LRKQNFEAHDSHQDTFSFSTMKLLSVLPTLIHLVLLPKIFACGLHHRSIEDIAPQYAPIPKSAEGLPHEPGSYAIESFGKGAYMVTEGAYQGRIVFTYEG
jgi:hypothetical protein